MTRLVNDTPSWDWDLVSGYLFKQYGELASHPKGTGLGQDLGVVKATKHLGQPMVMVSS